MGFTLKIIIKIKETKEFVVVLLTLSKIIVNEVDFYEVKRESRSRE